MENKKFLLTKENLDAVHFIQHIVNINIKTFDVFKDKDFNDEKVQHDFNLLCESYLKLRDTDSIYKWRGFDTEDIFRKRYIVQPSEDKFAYDILIDLKKSYKDCCSIGIQTGDRTLQFVPINIFNISFEMGG